MHREGKEESEKKGIMKGLKKERTDGWRKGMKEEKKE
jgi:hypothetical protein